MIVKISLKLNRFFKQTTKLTYLSTCLKQYDLKTPLFKQVLTNDLIWLSDLFKKYNYELRVAGGAVRDLLMDKSPSDIDLATNALPQEMLDMFKRENVRIFNLNGINHGTVTVRINNKSNFEITTLRIDVKTFGRHAEVEFTNDWHKDAIRRDLTVNALFLDLSGKVHDYVNGVEDLKNQIVRFVGIPDKRIKEDYLRILRYFRFYSRIRNDCNEHDRQSLEAIRNNVDGLKKISGERIGYELRKILSQKFSDSFIRIFYEFGIDKYLGLPPNGDVENYFQVYKTCFEFNPNPFTLVASLIKSEQDIENLNQRIKLSNNEKRLLEVLTKYRDFVKQIDDEAKLLEFLRREICHEKLNKETVLKLTEAIELVKYINRAKLIEKINQFEFPKFQITANDIIKHVLIDEKTKQEITVEDYSKGYVLRLNYILNDLKKQWVESNFTISFQDLMKKIDANYLSKYMIAKRK